MSAMGISCYDIKDVAMICFLLLFSEQDVKVKWQRDSTGSLSSLHSDVNLGECLGNANKMHLYQSNHERTYQWSGWICNETVFQMSSTMVRGCLAAGLQTCPPLTPHCCLFQSYASFNLQFCASLIPTHNPPVQSKTQPKEPVWRLHLHHQASSWSPLTFVAENDSRMFFFHPH